jgi:hypothetical protein
VGKEMKKETVKQKLQRMTIRPASIIIIIIIIIKRLGGHPASSETAVNFFSFLSCLVLSCHFFSLLSPFRTIRDVTTFNPF